MLSSYSINPASIHSWYLVCWITARFFVVWKLFAILGLGDTQCLQAFRRLCYVEPEAGVNALGFFDITLFEQGQVIGLHVLGNIGQLFAALDQDIVTIRGRSQHLARWRRQLI